MASSADAISHRPAVLLSGLPPAVHQILQRLLAMAAELTGLPAVHDAANLHRHRHINGHVQYYGGKTLRTPKLSVLGFASLLLGVASTLMLLGSFAFMLGLMLMPFILPASIVVCVGALLPAFKEGLRPSSSSASPSLWGNKLLQKEALF